MLETLDYEMMRYEKLPIPAGADYAPIEEDKPKRKGCDQDFSVRGDPDCLETPAEQRIVQMPQSMVKPLDYPGTSVICPHPTIRNYLSYKRFSEVDPEYALYPCERP